MSANASLKYLQSRPKEELKALYSSLHGVVPGVVYLNDNDRVSRPQLVEMILGVKGIRPRHLASIHNRTPFAIRDYLRRQAKREGLDHLMNKPWKLSGLEYAVLFGHRIAKGLRAEVANDNSAPSDEAMREALQNAASIDVSGDNHVTPPHDDYVPRGEGPQGAPANDDAPRPVMA